jgi:PAS domain S-box-containing protein
LRIPLFRPANRSSGILAIIPGNLMSAVVLAINTAPATTHLLSHFIRDTGHLFFAIETRTDGARIPQLDMQQPDIVMLSISGDNSIDDRQLQAIRNKFEDTELLFLVSESNFNQTLDRFKSESREFITTPVDPMILGITLDRILEKIALRKKLKKLEYTLENYSTPDPSRMVETERFIMVKQVIDKMTSFIAQIARDVEDGVKYFHSTPYFVSIHTCDLKIIANDSSYQKYFGNKVGKHSWEIYYGKTATAENCPVGKTVRTGTVQRTTAAVQYQSGTKVPVIVHTAPIYNNNGQMELILEVSSGSREIKHLRKELKTTQQRYQKLFDAVPDFIAVLDPDLHIIAVNESFKNTFGDNIGTGFFDSFKHIQFSEDDFPIRKTFADGESHQVETELTTKTGKRFNIILSTAPVKTIGDKVIQIIVVFKDITKIRRLEDNLSTLGLMFSVVSHNIKGILTGLDAGLYHIDRGFYQNIPGRIEEGLEVANLMAERIRKLILDVLYYARPRELHPSMTEVDDLIDEVGRQVRPKMGARNIDFKFHADPDSGEFEVDREIFHSILINLLENAMEACMDPRMERQFQISLKAEALVGDQVKFEVSDNGTGMDLDQQSNIFSKFFTTKGKKGTGLGLFIANQVVGQHGGEIHVTSTPSKGSVFTILMPKKIPNGVKTQAES